MVLWHHFGVVSILSLVVAGLTEPYRKCFELLGDIHHDGGNYPQEQEAPQESLSVNPSSSTGIAPLQKTSLPPYSVAPLLQGVRLARWPETAENGAVFFKRFVEREGVAWS